MKRDLRDKVILITGASSGIGRATALACAAAGMHVSMMARRESKLIEVAKEVSALDAKTHYFVGNVADVGAVKTWVEQAYQTFGRMDAVYANAGYGMASPMLDMTDADVRGMFEVNFFGTLNTLRAALPYVTTTPDGLKHLLVCSSCLSELGPPESGVYAATKGAQDLMAQGLRAELAGEGVKVTTVHPVGTKTNFFKVAQEQSGVKAGARIEPPGFLMQTPEHVAGRIVKALKRPRAEVWPMTMARFAAAMATAMPGLTAWILARGYARELKKTKGQGE
ncbi:MAG: SDR family oxidoreductase [Algisphaera sp.]